MTTRTAADWAHILESMGVKPLVFGRWAPVFAATIKPGTFSAGNDDLKAFLPQIIHESAGLTRLDENLNYSAQGLANTWARFSASGKRGGPPNALAIEIQRKPYEIAEAAYGGRMGNTKPGDGYRFRGRSFIMTTGYDNYARVGDLMGQDLTIMPELLEQPHFALEAAIAWWEDRIPDSMLGDPEKVSLRVNGGLIGLAQRVELTDIAERTFA